MNFFHLLQVIITVQLFSCQPQLMSQISIKRIQPTPFIYNSNRLLGKGTFGEVYLGFNEEQKKPIAVKVVSFEKLLGLMSKDTLMKKLKDQIVNMQIAHNQYLVTLFQAKASSKKLYMICQYCNGQSLEKFIQNKGYLSQNQALGFFQQILIGFKNLYEKKIVHRDLKPANLLMHNYKVKIADLGFSKAIDQHEQLLESMVGTPLYMSPQIFNKQKYTEKTDIWSLGVILYEMLYGKVPWKATSWLQLKQKVQKQNVQFPKSPMVTLQTKQLITSMLQLQEQVRIDWFNLFNRYLNPNNIYHYSRIAMNKKQNQYQMINQEQQNNYYNLSRKIFKYFEISRYLESQLQIEELLKQLRIQSDEFEDSFDKGQQFFKQMQLINRNQRIIHKQCLWYLKRRNKVTYLIKIMEQISKMNQHISIITTLSMFLIIKFTIHQLYKMLEEELDDKNVVGGLQLQTIKQINHIKALINNDLTMLQQFYPIFMNNFNSKLSYEQQNNPSLAEHINSVLSGLYTSQIGDLKFIQFLLINNLSQLFNELKSTEITRENMLVTRMIWQYNHDNNLFVLQSKYFDLQKKYWDWIHDQLWICKLKKIPNMNVEHINNYFSRTMTSNQFDYLNSFKNKFYEQI